MIITRDDVLAAIDQEPLMRGRYVNLKRIHGKCGVCAVGAILRYKGLTDEQIAIHTSHNLTFLNQFIDLSQYFEQITGQLAPSIWMDPPWYKIEKIKPELKKWVIDNFPDGVIYEK